MDDLTLPGLGANTPSVAKKTSSSKISLPGLGVEDGVNSIVGLEELAGKEGFKQSKVIRALQGVSRVLNIGTASMAGAVRGALRDEGIIKGIKEGVKENIGFSDVYRDMFGDPESRGEKVAVGAGGFIADIVFDPITYLTLGLGAGAKVGAKTLNKAGTKLLQETTSELMESSVERFIKEGLSKTRAIRLAKSDASRTVNELFQKTLSKTGLTDEAAEEFIKRGINTKNIETIQEMGTRLLDEGGIKWFGKTLVRSETLAKTPLGKAARRLGETEIAVALKNTLGKTFVDGFKKHPKILEIVNRANITKARAFKGINDSVNEMFKDVTEAEGTELFGKVFSMREEVIQREAKIVDEVSEDLNKLFPELKVTGDKDQARRLLESIDETAQKEMDELQKGMDEITKPLFEERQRMIKKGESLTMGQGVQETPGGASMARVDELSKRVEDMKAKISELRKQKGVAPRLGKEKLLKDLGGAITEDEVVLAGNKLIRMEEERLMDTLDELSERFAKLKEAPQGTKGAKVPKIRESSLQESIVYAQRRMKQIQDEIANKSRMLGKIVDARRIAKAEQKDMRLIFENPKLQKIADQLFEGNSAVIPQLAKLAGISEEDAFKFYLPSKFRDKVAVKEFAIGRNISSPSMGYREQFRGVKNAELITDPAKALKLGRMEVAADRIKTDAIQSVVNSLGKPVEEFTELAAKRAGYKKFTREGVKGKIEAWLPEAIHKELTEFSVPSESAIAELARVTGFDWATGLFKGYVTSLFPAFHIRNLTSNQFQLMLKLGVDALNPFVQKRALDIALGRNLGEEFITKTGQRLTNKSLITEIKKVTNLLDEGAFGSVEQYVEAATKGSNLNPLSRQFAPVQYMAQKGQVLEAQSKLVAIITAVMEGKTVKQGVKDAEDALFNYSKLTTFEKDIMKRVIPFYTFSRKNFEYQLKTLAKTPGRTAAQLKFIKGAGEAIGEPIGEEDKSGLPDFVLDSLGIKAGTNKFGQTTFLTGFGLPIEEFVQRFSGEKGILWNAMHDTLVKVNPVIKFPLERATGQDFFRDRPITEVVNADSMKQLIDIMPKPVATQFKELIQWKEIQNQPIFVDGRQVGSKTKYVANPFALHLFRNLPTSRLQQTAALGQNDEDPQFNVILRFFTGVRGWTIDQEEQKYFNQLNKQRELTDFLVRMGVVGRRDIVYKKDELGKKKGSVSLPGL